MKKNRLQAVLLSSAVLLSLLGGCGKSAASEEVSSSDTGALESSEEMSSEASSPESSSEESSSESTDEIKLTVVLDSTDGVMRFSFPEGWQNLAGSLDDGVDSRFTIQAGAYEEAAFFMAASEEKANSPVTDLSDYNSELLKAVTGNEAFSDVSDQVSDDLTLKNSGLAAHKTRFTASYSDQSIICWIITTEDDNRYYQMTFWTTASNVLAEEERFMAIGDSFTTIS